MEENKEKRLYPGDNGYPGGEYWTTMVIDGKTKNVRVVKDAYGNIVYMGVTDKIFGLF